MRNNVKALLALSVPPTGRGRIRFPEAVNADAVGSIFPSRKKVPILRPQGSA